MSNEKLPHIREAAAQMLATGDLEKQEIAKRLGINRNTLWQWETKDENFKARVGELKREFESFGIQLIESKLVDAVNQYWDLIQTTENARVKAEGYRYFIDRKLGKPTSRHEIETSLNDDHIDEDILEAEFEEYEDEE